MNQVHYQEVCALSDYLLESYAADVTFTIDGMRLDAFRFYQSDDWIANSEETSTNPSILYISISLAADVRTISMAITRNKDSAFQKMLTYVQRCIFLRRMGVSVPRDTLRPNELPKPLHEEYGNHLIDGEYLDAHADLTSVVGTVSDSVAGHWDESKEDL